MGAGAQRPPSLPHPAPKSEPLYLFWLSGALLSIYFFSLCFIFIFKLPAGLDAVHSPRCLGARRADCRSRLAGPGGSPASCSRGQGAAPGAGSPGTTDSGATGGCSSDWDGGGARTVEEIQVWGGPAGAPGVPLPSESLASWQ